MDEQEKAMWDRHMKKKQKEDSVWESFKVRSGQVYADLDSRSQKTGRHVKVLSVTSRDGQAACASCSADGKCYGRTVWIRFDRLSNREFFRFVADTFYR